MEEDARQEGRQPERLLVGDEVDLVPALREGDAELRGHCARAAVCGIARDPDLHSPAPCHQAARLTSSFACVMRVTSSPVSWCRNQVRWRLAYCRVSMITRSSASSLVSCPCSIARIVEY